MKLFNLKFIQGNATLQRLFLLRLTENLCPNQHFPLFLSLSHLFLSVARFVLPFFCLLLHANTISVWTLSVCPPVASNRLENVAQRERRGGRCKG